MSLVSAAPLFTARNSRSGYQIEQSLRFRGAQKLYLDPTDISITAYTFSAWVKRSKLGSDQMIWSVAGGGPVNWLRFNSDNTITWFADPPSGGGATWNQITTGVYRDSSAWMHVFVAVDTTLATQTDRAKLYINGELAPLSTASYPSQNGTLRAGSGYQGVGYSAGYDDKYLDGYLAEVHCVTGTAYDRTDFGEFDNNGVWRPIEVSGLTYGTNGFYLTFDPTATNGIGHDHSGNGNNWTPTGFDTTNTTAATYDVMSDTPTTNWCTWNPLDNLYSSNTLSDGNLRATTPVGANYGPVKSTFGMSTGKWYWECVDSSGTGASGAQFGIVQTVNVNDYITGQALSVGYQGSNGVVYKNASLVTTVAAFNQSDIIGFAFDADALTLAIYKNNSLLTTVTSITAGTWFAAACDGTAIGGGYTLDVNFGQRAFAYTPPTGYKALNTSNLSAPPIKDGSQYFNTVLYTGTSNSTQAITGVGFQPDFTWIKNKGSATDHLLFDAVRGVTKVLKTVGTGAEETDANAFQSFNSDGFTLGTSTNGNPTKANGSAYVAWNWLAGNGTTSNTDGSITSTVSANPSAGFSIVTYTGTLTSVANNTVGHGLGVSPKLIIYKNRSASANWHFVMPDFMTNTQYLNLNSTSGLLSYGVGSLPDPTSSVIYTLYSSEVDVSGNNFVAYCFAEVESYSKFGSYVGNGNADGPFVYTGHKVAFVMIKRTDAVSEWAIYDNERPGYNPDYQLRADQTDSENSGSAVFIDTVSNGFKIRTSDVAQNASGGSYVYMSFAENPFGGSGVSPATAR